MKYFILLIALFSTALFAQEPEVSGEIGVVLKILAPFLSEYAQKWTWLGKALEVMVTCRLVIKPLMSALLTIFKDTQFQFLSFSESVLQNKIYKTVAFILDWVISLKLPKSKE